MAATSTLRADVIQRIAGPDGASAAFRGIVMADLDAEAAYARLVLDQEASVLGPGADQLALDIEYLVRDGVPWAALSGRWAAITEGAEAYLAPFTVLDTLADEFARDDRVLDALGPGACGEQTCEWLRITALGSVEASFTGSLTEYPTLVIELGVRPDDRLGGLRLETLAIDQGARDAALAAPASPSGSGPTEWHPRSSSSRPSPSTVCPISRPTRPTRSPGATPDGQPYAMERRRTADFEAEPAIVLVAAWEHPLMTRPDSMSPCHLALLDQLASPGPAVTTDHRAELRDLVDRIGDYLDRVGRPWASDPWSDGFRSGWRIEAETIEPGLRLCYWLAYAPEVEGWWVAVDHVVAETPTRFARRIARIFTGETALRRIEHLVIAQVSSAGRDL